MRCQWCGNRNEPRATVCASCGKDLLRDRSTEEAIRQLDTLLIDEPEVDCPACGAANFATARYCTLCGNPLVELPPKRRLLPRPKRPHPIVALKEWAADKKYPVATIIAFVTAALLLATPFLLMGMSAFEYANGVREQRPEGGQEFESVPMPAVIDIPVPMGAQRTSEFHVLSGERLIGRATYRVGRNVGTVAEFYSIVVADLAKDGWYEAEVISSVNYHLRRPDDPSPKRRSEIRISYGGGSSAYDRTSSIAVDYEILNAQLVRFPRQ